MDVLLGILMFVGIFYGLCAPAKAKSSASKAMRLVRNQHHSNSKPRRKQVELSEIDRLRLKEVKLSTQLKEVRSQIRNNA